MKRVVEIVTKLSRGLPPIFSSLNPCRCVPSFLWSCVSRCLPTWSGGTGVTRVVSLSGSPGGSLMSLPLILPPNPFHHGHSCQWSRITLCIWAGMGGTGVPRVASLLGSPVGFTLSWSLPLLPSCSSWFSSFLVSCWFESSP